MTPDLLAEVMEATWPPARRWALGPVTLRDGAGGGKRVSAASVEGAFTEADLDAAPVAALQAELPPLTAFPHWPPLEVARSIWAGGGIGPARISVMDRVTGAKAAVLGRIADRPAGVAFVACHGPEAMVHALEVRPDSRRQGLGHNLLIAAANWAADQGATRLSLVVTRQNAAACALYTRLGMESVGQYHYRMK
jgi:ribosomal protein S18 acetylase RimI-like enzyme